VVKRNRGRGRLRVTGDGKNVVSHVGARLVADLADAVGLTAGLSAAMAPTKSRRRGHDRGRVLVDLAVMLADGGDAISDLVVLANQPDLFGQVASVPTAWRTLEAVDEAAMDRIRAARAAARRRAWAAGAAPGVFVIDLDGTLIRAHSDKEGAAPTYKKTFGHHPLLAFLDATGEALDAILRPGNAASNTGADHVTLLHLALAQLPVDPTDTEVVARADSAALSHEFIDACRAAQVRFSIGHDLTEPIRTACLTVPASRWEPAVCADGDDREGAEVAEITDLINLSAWPDRTRAIARREEPHPGAQLTFTDADGHRYQVFITDQTDPDIAWLELRQRSRGRAEKLICNLKGTGANNLPSANFAINAAWLTTALIAHDLLVWTRLVCLDGELAHAEPKRLRYCLLHTAGHTARSARRTHLRLPATWPWTDDLVTAFDRVQHIRLRT
jgi:hypothetical protein